MVRSIGQDGCVPDRFLCPVCGYPDLVEPPWRDDSASDEICPSCGTHFGYDDAGDAAQRQAAHRRLREAWVSGGMAWWSQSRTSPSGWDPTVQVVTVNE
ncbi:MAG: hypothetical protein QOJ92_2119 [Frankiales bacterium]|nr:hypothetical protein [Frankiales bacterium]